MEVPNNQYQTICKGDFTELKEGQKEQGARLISIEKKVFNGFGDSIAQIRKMLWFVLSGLAGVCTVVIVSFIVG